MLAYPLIAGVLFGLYFSLLGIGLNLVFGVMRIVNLAHGDFLMLGAFVAFGVFYLLGLDPLLAVPASFAAAGLVGIVLERLVLKHLYGRPLETLLATAIRLVSGHITSEHRQAARAALGRGVEDTQP